MPSVDYSDHVNEHRSASVRLLFLALGCLAVVIGIVGLFVPLLPTTPFMLLAAACFARASRRFYNWLLNNKTFGPAILEWRQHRSIAHRTKIVAILAMAITMSASILLVVSEPWLRACLGGLGILLAVWLYRIPSRDDPRNAAVPDRQP